MFDRIIRFSIEHRWLVMLATLGLCRHRRLQLPDACRSMPCPTSPMSRCRSIPRRPGYSPLEVEQRITFPIETAMAGLPDLEETRSLSRYGLSQVTVIFEDGTDIYFARQLVNQRLQEARGRCRPASSPMMGPIATGLGEIYLGPWSPSRREQAGRHPVYADRPAHDSGLDHQAAAAHRPRGHRDQHHRRLRQAVSRHARPDKLLAYGLTFGDVIGALGRNNNNVGAGYIEQRGEQYLIRGPGPGAHPRRHPQHRPRQPCRACRSASAMSPRSSSGSELRTGAATENGQEVVLGTVFMLMGENSRTVSQAVDEKMVEINRTLPAGRRVPSRLRPHRAGRHAINTVRNNLLEGAAARHRRAVPVPRQYPGGADHGDGHPAVDAVHLHRHGDATRSAPT